MAYVRIYTVERPGITPEGREGTTIEDLKFTVAEAVEECERRKDAENRAYLSHAIIVEMEDSLVPPEAEIVTPEDYRREQQ
jgi:hypothetical protein